MAITNKTMHKFNVVHDGNTISYEVIDKAGREMAVQGWADNSAKAFAAGEYIEKDGKLYKFKTSHKAGSAWNASEVEETNIGSELSNLNSDINEKADAANLYNYKTTSGSIVTVDDAEAESVKKLRIKINPVQDLHGYDNPWPAGGNVNLLPNNVTDGTTTSNGITCKATNGVYVLSGTATAIAEFWFDLTASVDLSPSTNKIAFLNSAQFGEVHFYRDNSLIHYWAMNPVNRVASNWTDSGNEVINKIVIKIQNGTNLSTPMTISPMLIKLTEDDPASFSPYSNICPISGWDSANVIRTGINIWDEETELGYIDPTTGQEQATNSKIRMKNYVPVLPNTTYYKIVPNNKQYWNVYFDRNKNYIGYGNPTEGAFTTPANCYYIRNGFETEYGTTYNHDISINYPATDTQYHPGQVKQIEYPFPQEAGTVYGAELTIRQDGTGMFVADRGCKRHTGQTSENWTYSSWSRTDTAVFYSSISLPNARADFGNYNCIVSCNMLPVVGYNDLRDNNAIGVTITGGGPVYVTIRIPKAIASTVEELKAYLENNPLDIVYELATSVTYQLTAQQVLTLLQGTNNIWADTGDIEIDYPVAKMISKDEADERYAGMIYVDGESAPIVSIEDGAENVPLKKLEVEINPVQDLHGYDYPWPAGGGVNLLPPPVDGTYEGNGVKAVVLNGVITLSGTTTSSGNALIIPLSKPVDVPVGSYFHLLNSVANGNLSLSFENSSNPGTINAGSPVTNPVNRIVQTSNASVVTIDRIRAYIGNGVTLSGTLSPMICMDGTARSFAPYSNVCPISGWDSANVSRTGVNVWDEETRSGYYDSVTGEFRPQSSTLANKNMIPVMPNTTYYCKSGTYRVNTSYFDKDMHYISGGYHKENSTFTTPANCYFMGFNNDFGAGATYNDDISINYPSTDTQYHAYSGSTTEYEFPQEAGTVYGGTLTIHQDGTGELVVDRASKLINELNFTYQSSFPRFYSDSIKTIIDTSKYNEVISDALESLDSFDYTKYRLTVASSGNVFISYPGADSVTALNNAIGNTKIVYPLATPVTYQLTNQQVLSLLKGQNNVWADCGNITLEYAADTKITIDGIRSDIVQLQNALIAPVLPGMVADTALAANDFRIVNSTLYRVTANIASGGTLTVGTNVVATTIGEQLKAILNTN